MKRVKTIVMAALVVALAVGVFALMSWDIPAPGEKVERVLPDDDFPR